jgi:DNA polymerase V
MATLDRLNARYGRGTVRLCSALTAGPVGARPPWQGQAQWQSSAFTTRLEDLLTGVKQHLVRNLL